MHSISNQVIRKFTNTIDIDEWSIHTDTGWEPLIDIKQTVEYEVWKLELVNGYTLECADNHIVFDYAMNEIFVCNLKPGDFIQTEDGPIAVARVVNCNYSEHMYDLGVDSENHRYYSNGILSHNTTTAVGYLLWYAMFVPDSTILIAAHKMKGAQEIMTRIRYAYETCPDFMRAGVTSYNRQSIEFDNGSRIESQTTTETTGRGMSLSLLFVDEMAHIEPNIAEAFWTSISPTLATGGKAIITSTPNSDEDQFAQIWHEAMQRFDEFGNETECGRNGFFPYKAIWSQHPDRDEAWAAAERGRVGESRFLREHECISSDSLIDVKWPNGIIKRVSITDLQMILRSCN